MAKASVGFASSTNQVVAAQAKREKRRANIMPLKSKAEIRAEIAAAKGTDTGGTALQPQNHDTIRAAWRETAAEMKLVIRDMRARKLAETVRPAPKPPVVFETFVQVVEDVPAPVAKPSPLPDKVMVIDTAPLLLPARLPRPQLARRLQKIASQYEIARSGDVILLPAYFGGDFAAEAAAARAAVRAEYEQEHEVKLPEYKPLDFSKQPSSEQVSDGSIRLSYQSSGVSSMYRNRKG